MSEKNSSAKKGGFSSKIGFVLAAAGSAVGLGNIWRFPYLAAEYGGGMFLLVYLILTVTFGFALMITETSIGRKTGKSVIGAYSDLSKKFSFLGWIAAVVPVIIFPYYCVIGGWVLKYLTVYLTGGVADAAAGEIVSTVLCPVSMVPGPAIEEVSAAAVKSLCGPVSMIPPAALDAVIQHPVGTGEIPFFSGFISGELQPTIFFVIYLVLTAVIVMLGVEKGIEKFSKFLMPVLIVMILGISIYSLTLNGAVEGFIYYITPNFENFSLKTVVAAMGQLFYSMSLAMGIMVTYGSYMRKEDNLEGSVRHIEIFDTGVAFLAGMMIIPAVFAFPGEDGIPDLGQGPSMMFVALPKVFNQMPGGQFIGIVFFVLVALAALTSSISLMETIVSIVMEKTKMKRISASLVVLGGSFIIGMLSVLGYSAWSDVTVFGMQFLDFFDFISNSVIMPVVALLTCILIGYVVKTKVVEQEVEINGRFKSKLLYRIMVRYVCPVFMVAILLSALFKYV